MPALVLDCSVTLSMAFAEEFDDYSRQVFETIRTGGALVPSLWHLEVANILSSGVKRNRLAHAEALRFLTLLARHPIETAAEDVSFPAANFYELAQRHTLTAYDAAYLRLALSSGLPLASKDKALNAAARAAGVALFAEGGQNTKA